MRPGKTLLKGVERTGPDVPVDYAQGTQGQDGNRLPGSGSFGVPRHLPIHVPEQPALIEDSS